MKVFFLETSPNSRKGGGIRWSPTTSMPEFRIYSPGETLPFPRGADEHPLGPLPAEVRDAISSLWALTGASNDKLPDWFMELNQNHFTGLQSVNARIAEVYRQLGGKDIEIIQLPNMWSIKDNAPVAQPYYLLNVYGAEETLDLELSKARAVVNPRILKAYKFSVEFAHQRVRQGFQTSRHVWRDKNTSRWYCDEAFKAALEKASRASYMFTQIT